MPHRVFITGATGYIGSALVPLLLHYGHNVKALVRQGSEKKLKAACEISIGNALSGDSYASAVSDCDTLIHLVGVPHPSPAKALEFIAIDLKSAQEAIKVAAAARMRHFIYVSVAHPAPVMKAYLRVRTECEATLRASGLNSTIVRPWYVLGPGHRWPLLLKPLYRVAELIPSTRAGARRLGLVSRDQMIHAITAATDDPPSGVRVFGVPEIRQFSQNRSTKLHIGARNDKGIYTN